MSDAPSPSAAPPAGPSETERSGRRTHPLTGLVQGGIVSGGAAVAIAVSYLQGDQWGGVSWWLAILMALGGGLVIGLSAGLLGWWFTRYVIDAEELRIDRGVVTKQSRRIPFARIQSVDVAEPLLARLAGLAELRITMAGGSETGTQLRFLAREDAERLRALLLELAHGPQTDGPNGSAGTDVLITRIPPARAVLGVALSLDLLGAVGAMIVILAAAVGFGEPLVFFGGFVPVALWAVRIVGSRVIAQWGFALFRTSRGLRIERGLLSRTSQTIPYARVQGVRRGEPIVWRALGWQRLDVDVAGYSGQGDGDAPTSVSSVLLPIADVSLAQTVLDGLMPVEPPVDADDPSPVATARAAPVSRLFAPIGWRYRWIRLGAVTASSCTGWIDRRTSVIPYDKAQSVAVTQGPLQRRLGVASLHLHTPEGPVDVDAHHLPAERARELALDAVERARRARG